MVSMGIVLEQADNEISRLARASGLQATVAPRGPLPYDYTLIVGPGQAVPWPRLGAGFALLDRWDALVPIGAPGLLAADLGTETERRYTRAVVRDLRLPVYEPGLLFVRRNEDGQALVDAYRDERGDVAQPQLAFLRAYYRVKARVCVLPRLWLGIGPAQPVEARQAARSQRPRSSRPLVEVEVAPGVCVKCYVGDEQKVREQYAARRRGRRR